MKAHIAVKPVLLCCQAAGHDLDTLRALSQAGRFELRQVSRAEAGKTVGALCGVPGASKAVVPVRGDFTQEPILVLYQFSEVQLDALLAGLKSSGVKIPLKAALTATNQSWAFCALAAELEKEHAALHSAKKEEE